MDLSQKLISVTNNILKKTSYSIQLKIKDKMVGYIENPEVGSKNFSVKMKRKNNGGPFEWPNIVALNKALGKFIQGEKTIVNIGAGTGTFEWYASENKDRKFIASEFDKECVDWCKKNRQKENIIYNSLTMQKLQKEYGKFELAVSVDVIEHVNDYGRFLEEFSELSDRAIITTPNKARNYDTLTNCPPAYYQHVREWTAGEFYWVLKIYYKKVELYAMPDAYQPKVKKIGLLSTMTPLIAVCEK